MASSRALCSSISRRISRCSRNTRVYTLSASDSARCAVKLASYAAAAHASQTNRSLKRIEGKLTLYLLGIPSIQDHGISLTIWFASMDADNHTMQILYVHATIANTRSNVINKYDSLSL